MMFPPTTMFGSEAMLAWSHGGEAAGPAAPPESTLRGGGATEGAARRVPDEELQQFESIFYALMVKQLRTSLSEDGLFPGESTDSYGVLFDQLMGQHLAQAQPLGIARMLAAYQEAAAGS